MLIRMLLLVIEPGAECCGLAEALRETPMFLMAPGHASVGWLASSIPVCRSVSNTLPSKNAPLELE